MKLVFGIHNHQPVGNFDYVFEAAYRQSYGPFLDVIEHFPKVKFTLHTSGPLLEWLESNHPEYIERYGRLVADGRCEIISSGFYEPVLISITDSDKIGQIEMMNDYIERRFGMKPEGLWLTERIWEPGLVRPLVEAGIKYIAVDDQHLSSVGLPLPELSGYYLTEDQGRVLGVFPISQHLRYSMPFADPGETIDFLKKQDTVEDALKVMVDDGEKFGVWPGTHEHCFTERWLERMFSAIEENQSWLTTQTLGEYFHHHRPAGRVYMPTASYFEMNEWTLPTDLGKSYGQYVHSLKDGGELDRMRPFLKGGTWRDFLTKYEESNWMLKRANKVSSNIRDIKDPAKKTIWAAQCNCAYWHGIFGGLYLPHLRHALYEHVIAAEKSLTVEPYQEEDLDHDGLTEIQLRNSNLNLFLTPRGGAVRELDVLAANFNLVNTLARYEEHYHHKLTDDNSHQGQETASIHDLVKVKEEGLENHLFVDSHPRWLGLDHFLAPDITVTDLHSNQYAELGSLVNAIFQHEPIQAGLRFLAEGSIDGNPVRVSKEYRLNDNGLNIRISFTNLAEQPIDCRYALELNFALLGGNTPDRYFLFDGKKPGEPHLASMGSTSAKEAAVVTEWEGIRANVVLREPTEIWRYPVETVSMSEAGFERVYQSSVLLPIWKLKIEPGAEKTFELQILIETGIKTHD